MTLKDKFLTFVELHHNANSTREAHGPDDSRTVDAYQNFNQVKREIADAIEELEYRIESLEK